MIRETDDIASVLPEVIITKQPSSNVKDDDVPSRTHSRDRSSRSVSISRLKVNDPIRKELMFVREKSPFEIGDNRNVQIASSKAIIDKASIMDVSGGITKVDEYVSLFFSSGCVIDEAVCRHPNLSEEHDIEIIVVDDVEVENPITKTEQTEVMVENLDASKTDDLLIEEPIKYTEPDKKNDIILEDENVQSSVISSAETNQNETIIDETSCQPTDSLFTNQDLEHSVEATLQEIIEEKQGTTNIVETENIKTEQPTKANNETEESSEEEEESSSDESFDELVDPSLWKAYDSNDEDDSAWFYKRPEDPTPELTEKEKDEEFRKDRLAKRIPIFLTNLTDRSGVTGSEIKLQCSIDGFGVTTKWMKDDNVIERSSKIRTTAVDGLYSLFIKHLEKSDEGIYTIVAKNRGGEVSSFARVQVYDDMKEKIEIPTIIKIRDFYHHALNDLIIECQIMTVPSKLIPDIMWLKDDDPLTFNNRIRATYEGNELYQLSIYNPTPDDSGVYTCIAKNNAGQSRISHEVEFTSKVHYIHLPGMHHADKKILSEEELMQKEIQNMQLAQERAAYKTNSRAQPSVEPYKEESYVIRDSKNKLKWAGQLSNQTVQKGQTVKMICSVIGQQAILKWQKNNKAIDFDSRVKLMNSGVIGQIVISDVSLKDAGEYVCHAKNNYNEIKTSCILKVIELPVAGTSPPMFIKAIKEFFNLQTNDLILETQVGTPNTEIEWYKDNEKIIYDDKNMLNREPNGRYQLRIHKPQSTDCGMYECRAKNNDGQAKIKHEVKFNSSEQFVHAHRIEHVERFKRNVVEDSTLSLSSDVLPQSVQSVQEDQQESLSNEQQNTIKSEATDQGDETREADETSKPLKPASAPKPKAMPRRNFTEGPIEPFIIRDSKKKLTWEAKIKNVTTAAGKDIKIVCIVAGPQPQFKWFKNGKPLVWSTNVINKTKGEFGCVIIKNASSQDNGEYTAQAKNADSEIECSGTVNVFTTTKQIESAPTFTRITDYYDIRVNDLVVEVQVRGIPCPTLIWERDGREFKNGMDRVIISREKDGVHKLSIHNPEKLDGGQWVITAVNSAGEEKVKHRVIFKGKEQCEYVPGIYHADLKTSRGNDEMVSIGRSRSASRAASVFSVRSQLNDNALVIAENELEQANLKDSTLENEENVIQKSKKPQKKEWRSKLSALYSNDQCSAPQASIKPKTSESKQKLHFEAQLKNMTAVEGNPVKLVCSCVGPSPSLKWFKNNIPIVWSKNVKNDSKLGVGAITIKNATESDSGEYKCVATNNYDEVVSYCMLSVFKISGNQHEPPKFTKNVREYYNGTVNDLILEVQVRGNPPPTIKWFRDGIELQDTEGEKFFQMREPDGIHKLTIHDPQRMDEGRYMIEAENIAGKETIKHEIKKLNKDEYCHVYGIKYHDPTIMKHGAYEEPSEEKPETRESREFVFLDDGSYYIRGQTPENLWEWETDTSAESEYEPYVPTSDDEIEPKEEEEEEEDEEENDENNTDNEKVDDEQDTEIPSDGIKASSNKPEVIKRGPKIKKMRKKVTKQPSSIIPDKSIEVSSNINLLENELLSEKKQMSDLEKDAYRRERYHKLFPELIPEPSILKPDKNTLKFMTELRDVTVMEGASFRLFCTVLGPKPEIKWLKNDEPMEYTKTIKNQTHDYTGIVHFSKASISDEGVYTVMVKHKDCTISSQANVKIVQKPVLTQGSAPRFITGINQHYDCRVDDLILETHIKGDGLLNVQWFLDGIEISNNEKYIQIREPLGVYKLCIHNPQIRDNGNYIVRVSNDYGTEELKYHLRLEGKQDKSCYGIFHADPRRQYKDDEIKEQRQYREVVFLEDGTYYVRGQTPEQFWEWETDTSAESEYEIIEVESDHSPDETEDHDESDKEDKEERSIDEDDEATKEQSAVDANQSEENQEEEYKEEEYKEAEVSKSKTTKRGPKIKKMRKKIYKAPEIKPQIQLDTKKDYKTEMQSKQRISKQIQIDEPKDVVAKPKKKPKVEFISRLRNQTLMKGKTLCLNCCCSDNTKIEVSWFKNGEKFEMNRRCVSDVHFGFITLEIYRTVIEDSGTYECFVKTANGEAKDSCKITVFELPDKDTVDLVPPTFLQPLKEIYHPTTNDLHLETRVRGNPVPTFTWICDGVFIHHSTDKYEIFNQHYYELGTKITAATLIINDPQMKDSGKYTLIAKNDVQSVEIFKQVKIGIRSEAHKKKRMDEVVIENDAPRVLPKPPTPEPVNEKDDQPITDEKNTDELSNAPVEEEQKDDEDDDDDDWLNV